MEWKLCALGQCAQQNQGEHYWIVVIRSNPGACRQYRVEVIAAHDASEPDDSKEQAHSARGRDDESHPCAAPRVGTVVPVGNQHEGSEARQLPEHDELDEI